MKTILDCSKFSKLFMDEQAINTNVDYRFLHFCVQKKIGNDTIIYNNLTKKMVVLMDDEVEAIKKLPCKRIDVLDSLIKEWFIVPMEHDDCKLAEELFQLYKSCEDYSYINNYVILTTTDCNARCFYCYEHGVTKNYMSEQTANDTADFIIKKCGDKPVHIKWFGGEPLCNWKVIDIICNKLKKNNIDFKTSMTSNAYLFNDEIIKKANENWNLKHVQITLDGTEEVYNRIKAFIYRDDKSAFEIVTNNIEKLMNSNIKVGIRMNVSDNNRSDIYKLVDYICERYTNKDNLHAYSSNLFDLDFTRTNEETMRLNQEFFKLDKYMCEKGLRKYSLDKWRTHDRGCMAQRKNSVAISPMGLLGNCEHFSEGEKMYGSIYNDQINQFAIDYWYQHKRIEACKTCVAYPDCYGISNCPDLSKKCEIAEKVMKEYNLDNSILEKYYEWKNNDA